MAEAIMAAYQRHAVKYHLDVNGRRPHLNLVVCDDLAKSLGASGVERLQRHLEPWDVAVFTRETAPPHFLAEKWKCDECQVFCVQSKFDSPLVGVAESSTWWGSLGANGFTNVTVFLMGFWIRVATWRSWVA
jgi:hypothetical protein